MSATGMSFAERGGRVVSRRGRRRTGERERASIEARFAPSARELFPVLRERLLASRPVIEPERVFDDTITVLRMRRVRDENGKPAGRSEPVLIERVVRSVVPAVCGASSFRNVIEDGEHR